MFKHVIILFTLISFAFGIHAQSSDRYAIGNQKKEKHHFHFSLKHLFKQDPQKKADRKKEKEDIKARKQHIKDVENYQKKHNSSKEVSTRKPAYDSMKKNNRLSKRGNENKPRDPWIVRIFKRKK